MNHNSKVLDVYVFAQQLQAQVLFQFVLDC